MNKQEIIGWLRCKDEEKLHDLWRRADSVRRGHVGNEVHLRGLIEISNICARDCRACMHRRIISIGRKVGSGQGDSPNRNKKRAA